MLEPPTRRQIGPQLPARNTRLNLGGQIREFSKLVGRRVDAVHRSLAMQLFSAVVMDTPIDTGLARGSWQVSKNSPIMGGGQRKDSGLVVLREIEAVARNAKQSEPLFLMNSVEYIVELEYGWSKQSPEGMVRINVARIQQYIKQSVAAAQEVK